MTHYHFTVKMRRNGMMDGLREVRNYITQDQQALIDWLASNISDPYEFMVEERS